MTLALTAPARKYKRGGGGGYKSRGWFSAVNYSNYSIHNLRESPEALGRPGEETVHTEGCVVVHMDYFS